MQEFEVGLLLQTQCFHIPPKIEKKFSKKVENYKHNKQFIGQELN